MSKKPRIVVVGSSNTDMIVSVEHIPAPGETILGGAFATAAGGKGANQAVAAARAGGEVTFVARVGADSFGDAAVAGFRRDGINVSHVTRDQTQPSGVALIFVANSGENSIGVAGGANNKLSPADIQRAAKSIASASALVLQLETPLPTVSAAAALAAKHGVRVILNPAPGRPLPDSLLKKISILTPNETEAEILTGVKISGLADARRAAGALLARGVGAVILTLGAQGAWVADADGGRHVSGYKVKAADTTAAGDTFNGALAVALAGGENLSAAARFANAAAALSVTKKGAQPSVPKRAEIEKLIRSAR